MDLTHSDLVKESPLGSCQTLSGKGGRRVLVEVGQRGEEGWKRGGCGQKREGRRGLGERREE